MQKRILLGPLFALALALFAAPALAESGGDFTMAEKKLTALLEEFQMDYRAAPKLGDLGGGMPAEELKKMERAYLGMQAVHREMLCLYDAMRPEWKANFYREVAARPDLIPNGPLTGPGVPLGIPTRGSTPRHRLETFLAGSFPSRGITFELGEEERMAVMYTRRARLLKLGMQACP